MYFSEYPVAVFLEKSDTSNNAILERELNYLWRSSQMTETKPLYFM